MPVRSGWRWRSDPSVQQGALDFLTAAALAALQEGCEGAEGREAGGAEIDPGQFELSRLRVRQGSWRDPAGASPAQVRGSARLVVSVASAVATPQAKRTQQSSGVSYRAAKVGLCRGRGRAKSRRRHERCRHARRRRPAVVQELITLARIASEPGRSRVWPAVGRRGSASGRRGAGAGGARAREV
jgi:hypothetical protein